jgi:hypothetical protein
MAIDAGDPVPSPLTSDHVGSAGSRGGGDGLSPGRSRRLPPEATSIALLGVDYAHLKTGDGGDLYLTAHGLAFWEHLLPENWYAREWFEANRERLVGTSTVYRVPTKRIQDTALPLVVKWSRVGEDVPLDTLTINKFINAEFNSPFEEFSLLMELRAGENGPAGIRVRAQRPLAIYVPSERLQLWQTGRSESKIALKVARHPGVELDILRQYVVLYGWIKGKDAVETADEFKLQGEAREEFFTRTTSLVMHELEQKGYRVVDMKPAHVILRPQPDGTLLRDRNGQIVYGIVDYELLERTPEHERAVRSLNRQYYLQHMARRFETSSAKPLPAHLKATNLLGVDYIFGHAESTGGLLWVVGKDPDLFNYFLPERWRRTPKRKLSPKNQVFYTRTKDNINLVWKVSRMGDTPAPAGTGARAREILNYGFNTPFEEFAFALELGRGGVKTVYPRAIYMTGHRMEADRKITDPRRYTTFEHLLTPDGQPALRKDHDYITIWGFWNGPDEYLAAQDGQFYRGINAAMAHHSQLIPEPMLKDVLERGRQRLAQSGFEDLSLKGDHLLLSFTPNNQMVRDTIGKPEVRLCNFELMRQRPAALTGAAANTAHR